MLPPPPPPFPTELSQKEKRRLILLAAVLICLIGTGGYLQNEGARATKQRRKPYEPCSPPTALR